MTWLSARARELTTHFGAALFAISTYAAAHPDVVAAVLHQMTGRGATADVVQVGAVVLGGVAGVLVGKPNAA